MKFLVLSLFVCAASAASFPAYKPYQQAKAFASVVVPPVKSVYVEDVVQTAKVAPVFTQAVTNVKAYSGKDVDAAIVRYDNDVNENGFSYTYETSNGIAGSASGAVKKVDNNDVLEVQGQYQYVSPDGEPIQVSYVANENGFQPDSAILPKAPPVPEAIVRALAYIAAHPPKEEVVYKKL